MHILTTFLIFMALLAALLGTFLTVKRWSTPSRRRVTRPSKRRYGIEKVPGISPITLRASRQKSSLSPTMVNMLPTAVVSPHAPTGEISVQQKRTGLQTTVPVLPLPSTLVLSSCSRCGVPVRPQDVFCGSCGLCLHRTT